MPDPVTVGVVCSSGGSVIAAAYEIINAIYPGALRLRVATDRPCGIEEYCVRHAIPHQRFSEPDNQIISRQISDYFSAEGPVDFVLLFYLRLVGPALFTQYPTLNIHPSLLPEFAGFNALKRALSAGVSEIGTTLHMAHAGADDGARVAQIAQKMPSSISEAELGTLSYCQKLYLTLWLIQVVYYQSVAFTSSPDHGYAPRVDAASALPLRNPRMVDPVILAEYRRYLRGLGYTRWITEWIGE